MALSDLSAVADALSLTFAPDLVRQDNRITVLGSVIPTEPGEGAGGGKSVNWDVEMDGATAASYAEGDDVAAGELQVDTDLPATLSWAHYRSAFHVSDTQLDAARSSMGSDGMADLLRNRFTSSVTKLASKINQDLWSGDGTDGSSNPTIVGLHGGALEASGSYAGIDRGSYSLWDGNVLENGGVDRALTMDLIDQMFENIETASGQLPNAIVAHPSVVRKYRSLFSGVHRVDAQGPISRLDASASLLFYRGVPILGDKDAPAKTMTFLCTPFVKKVFLPSTRRMDVWKTMQVEGAGSDGAGVSSSLMMPFEIVPLARSGDSQKFMVKAVCQLKVTRPGALGYIKDISVA